MMPTSSWSSAVVISRSVTISTVKVFQASRCKGGFAHLEKGEANGGERGGRPVEFKSTFRRKTEQRDGRTESGKKERRQRRYLCTYAGLKVRESVSRQSASRRRRVIIRRQFRREETVTCRVCKSFETIKFWHIYQCHCGDIIILGQLLMYPTATLDKKKGTL